MKLSKEELKQKIDEVITDEDVKIGLLEDIEDSFDVVEDETEKVDKTAYDEVVAKYEEIKTKYKERFLKGDDKKEDEVEDKKEDDEELEEEKVVDVKEI